MSFVHPWVFALIPVLWLLLRGGLRRTSLPVPSLGLWADAPVGRAARVFSPQICDLYRNPSATTIAKRQVPCVYDT